MVEDVILVKKHKAKMIMTPFSVKGIYWHMDKTNCKKNEVIEKTNMISWVKFDKSLSLRRVYSYRLCSGGIPPSKGYKGGYWGGISYTWIKRILVKMEIVNIKLTIKVNS